MLEILSKNFNNPAEEVQARLHFLARQQDGGLKVKLSVAMRLLGLQDLTASKAKSYWYGAVNSVPSHHMDRIRSLTGAVNDNVGRLPCISFLISTLRSLLPRMVA